MEMDHWKSLVQRVQLRIDQPPLRGNRELEAHNEGKLDGLLCSCNARSRKTLVGHAQWETI